MRAHISVRGCVCARLLVFIRLSYSPFYLSTQDTDKDGYLAVEETMAVLLSYNQIYRFNFAESKIKRCLKDCTNGSHAEIDRLLRYLLKLFN